MMKKIALIVIGYGLANVLGCSYVAGYFPDKEKDYHRTKEIPLLNWPAELRDNATPKLTTPSNALAAPATDSAPSPVPNTENLAPNTNINADAIALVPDDSIPTREAPILADAPNPDDPTTEEALDKNKPVSIEQLKSDGISRLRLNVSLTRTWRLVGKALSRQALEVTERNPDKGQYTVQYDPNETRVQDGSLWDEVIFIFQGFQNNEQAYHLKVQETEGYSEVVIVDAKQKPITDTVNGVKLLDLLEKTIKTNLATN